MIFGIVGFLILAAWLACSVRVRTEVEVLQSNDLDRSDVPTIPALMGRVTAPIFRRGAAAIGKQSARNYGSGPLPRGYWRPEAVKDLVPINRNRRALVAFSRPIVTPRFLAMRPPVVPPAIRFNHLRVLSAVSTGNVGVTAWSHGFWGRDYSLLPVEVGDGERPEWLVSTMDPEAGEPTCRYLTPSEIDALGLGNGQKMASVATMEPCIELSWSTWLNCLLRTPEEHVTAEKEVAVTNKLDICRDAIVECDESSCDNGLRPYCAKTCGIYPCPPVEREETADDQSIVDAMSATSDVRAGCTIMSCMSLVGRMFCKETCGTILTSPAQTPYKTEADLDTFDDSYLGCTVLDCMTLVGRLMCQKTCHFHPSQKVLKKPAPKIQKPAITDIEDLVPNITDIEDLVLNVKAQPSSLAAPQRKVIKIEYQDDNRVKEVMDHVIEDELQAQDQQKTTLPDVVLADDSSGEEVQQILDKATADPGVLLKGAELHDSLCGLLTVGAFNCIAVGNKCRCFYTRVPGKHCSHMYPNRKTALWVVKNERLALFPFDQCTCETSKKISHKGNLFYSCDLAPFSLEG